MLDNRAAVQRPVASDARAPSPTRRLVGDPVHGPLPALMLVLTVVTGVVDAVSILSLGRVFVANMTGNVVFVGFPSLERAASLWPRRCPPWRASSSARRPAVRWPADSHGTAAAS
jgi:uncharacterized protein DUF1275